MQQQQKKEKVRIFALARELGMESKDLVVFCQENGLDVKSQLSTIEPEVRDQILQLVKKGTPAAAAPASPAPAPAPVPTQPKRDIRTIQPTRGGGKSAPTAPVQPPAPAPTPAPAPAASVSPVSQPTGHTPPSPAPNRTPEPPVVTPPAPTPVVEEKKKEPPQPAPKPVAPQTPPPAITPLVSPASATPAATPTPPQPAATPTTPPAVKPAAAQQPSTPVVRPAAPVPATPVPVSPPKQVPAQVPAPVVQTPAPVPTPTTTTKETAPVAAKVEPTTPKEKQPIPTEKPTAPVTPAPAAGTPHSQPTPPTPPVAPPVAPPAQAVKQQEQPKPAPRQPEQAKPSQPGTRPAPQQPVASQAPPTPPQGATQPPAPPAQPAAPQPAPQQAKPPTPVVNRNPVRNLTSPRRDTPPTQGGQGGQSGTSSGSNQGTPPQGGQQAKAPQGNQNQGGQQPRGQGGQGNQGQSGQHPRPQQGQGQGNQSGSGQGQGGGRGGQSGSGQHQRPGQSGRQNTGYRVGEKGGQSGQPKQGGQQQKGGQQPPKSGGQPSKPPASTSGAPVKLSDITPEMLEVISGRGDKPPTPKELLEHKQRAEKQAKAGTQPGPVLPPVPEVDDTEDDRKRKSHGGGTAAAGGAVPGRAERHKERSERQKARKGTEQEGRGGKPILIGLDDETRHRKVRPHHKPKQPPTVERKGKIPVSVPITVRSLSEAMGKKATEVIFKVTALSSKLVTINSSVEPEVAELVAVEYGLELDIKRAVDVEAKEVDRSKQVDLPENLLPRAPIVTIMGHVDHGKTSLLDRIRETYGLKSDVVSSEAGGITQVIRAWRVEKDGHPITFLDTPGHEAFTKMRARGANVTDIAVIVVAANDGVMPQTEEAINHAKAAGVSIVVAINKVDLPDANLGKTERRLMDLSLYPDTMGGDVPFVQTSAKTGKGIDKLLEQLSVVAELKELKANPNKSATGTCLEAYKSEQEGVQATLLVRDGTLKTGDIVLCGASYGTVRRMYDDLGRTINEAGPSVPVRILGLDEVPNADDPFLVVDDLTIARGIAEDRKIRVREQAQGPRLAIDFTNLRAAKITELKVIIKAEARGSIEAIRNELEKFQHDEVRVRILHAAIGGITESDVQLALTSPTDSMIVGFNVVPDNDAKALAEARGITIRQYNIIYQLADDIKAALEGKLKPREEVVQLGRAIVRKVFKISRVGTIAGCYVTQGVMERSAKVRVIRAGVVVYPPAERTVGLDSLKRVKDDVREVREGFECGLKISAYDDIKVDDVIECYRVEHVQRTLDG